MNHVHEKVTFDGVQARLSGTLQLPDRPVRGGIVLAHCFTCSKSFKVIRHLATGIEAGGYAVLRFDFTGLGESEGDFTHTNVTTQVGDLGAAVSFMRRRGFETCALVGHSLGGAAALLTAHNTPDVGAVVAVAAPSDAAHVRHLFAEDDVQQALDRGSIHVNIGGRGFEISAAFFQDLERHGSPEHIAALNRPLMVVHGTADRVVEIGEGEKIFAAAQQPRWFAAIPGADHLFSKQAHAERAASAIVPFLHSVL